MAVDLSYLLDPQNFLGFKRVAVRGPKGWVWFSPPVAGDKGNLSMNVLELWCVLALMQGFPQDRVAVVSARGESEFESFDLAALDAMRPQRSLGDEGEPHAP